LEIKKNKKEEKYKKKHRRAEKYCTFHLSPSFNSFFFSLSLLLSNRKGEEEN